jgi:hypothetical protein
MPVIPSCGVKPCRPSVNDRRNSHASSRASFPSSNDTFFIASPTLPVFASSFIVLKYRLNHFDPPWKHRLFRQNKGHNADKLIKVVEIRGGKVRIGIVAPEDVDVDRQEIHEKRLNNLRQWSGSTIYQPVS